jgi:ABC-type spermidine/putrescine transport system permease subunit II
VSRRVPRPAVVVTVLVMAFLYAPILLVLVNSVNADTSLLRWEGFTTTWYRQAFTGDEVRDALVTSAQIAVLSTVISLVLAITAGLWLRGASQRARRLFDALTYSRIVLPEVVFALGLFIVLKRAGIEFGVGAIVLGHVVFNSAYATIIIQARLATMGPTLEEAAADLGANRLSVFRRVTLPLLAPAVIVAGLLTLTFSFDDVIVSQFLSGTDTTTLPVLLLGKIRIHVTPEVNAIGAGMMVITLTSFALVALVSIMRPAGARAFIGFGRER